MCMIIMIRMYACACVRVAVLPVEWLVKETETSIVCVCVCTRVGNDFQV